MISKKEENESVTQARERLAEIGQILCIGIRRLMDRETSKNSLNQLDYTTKSSVHGVNINYSQ